MPMCMRKRKKREDEEFIRISAHVQKHCLQYLCCFSIFFFFFYKIKYLDLIQNNRSIKYTFILCHLANIIITGQNLKCIFRDVQKRESCIVLRAITIACYYKRKHILAHVTAFPLSDPPSSLLQIQIQSYCFILALVMLILLNISFPVSNSH